VRRSNINLLFCTYAFPLGSNINWGK